MHKNRLARRIAKRLLFLQCIITLGITLVAAAFFGIVSAYSAFSGGIVSIIPSQMFAYKFLNYSGAQATKKIIRSLYSGEILKIIFSVFLFILVFAVLKVSPLAFFTTFIIVQLSHWIAPLLLANEVAKLNKPKPKI